ncbi:MAG: MBL fold metallo-hydrolase [Anaerolineae bacterium]|nr:MBL fold metallo-hydrolase [Anaerolineae bacterium]
MDLVRLTGSAYQLHGGSNAGLIVQDGRAILVDTGLDKDTAKKILRIVESLRVRLAAVVITHAHADHFGGAATVRARTGVPVYAPALEAAIVANPILEPLYLFSGASPAAEWRHKFTLADACPVDGLLEAGDVTLGGVPFTVIAAPGHAPNQMMIAGGGVCFVADACFAPEILRKHGIPFYVDVEQTTETLNKLSTLDGKYSFFVPGHGEAVREIGPWAEENAARLAEIRQAVAASLAEADDLGGILQRAAARLGLQIPNPVVYTLTQTTILACLSALQKAGSASVRVVDNRLCWTPA